MSQIMIDPDVINGVILDEKTLSEIEAFATAGDVRVLTQAVRVLKAERSASQTREGTLKEMGRRTRCNCGPVFMAIAKALGAPDGTSLAGFALDVKNERDELRLKLADNGNGFSGYVEEKRRAVNAEQALKGARALVDAAVRFLAGLNLQYHPRAEQQEFQRQFRALVDVARPDNENRMMANRVREFVRRSVGVKLRPFVGEKIENSSLGPLKEEMAKTLMCAVDVDRWEPPGVIHLWKQTNAENKSK